MVKSKQPNECFVTYPNLWLICWKKVVMLLSSSMSGGADVELPKPDRAGADKSNSLKLWKPPRYGKSWGPRNVVWSDKIIC